MARGGKRQGAGRRKGHGPVTKARIAVAEKALAAGLNPLDYMLATLRDESRPHAERFAAAKEAAPFVHPKLAAVEMSGNEDKPLVMQILTSVPRPNQPGDADAARRDN
jgi:hypothetical protein